MQKKSFIESRWWYNPAMPMRDVIFNLSIDNMEDNTNKE